MSASGIALRAIRNDFFKEVTEQYHTTNEEIVRILINGGYEAFNPDNLNIYRQLIAKHFALPEAAPSAAPVPAIRRSPMVIKDPCDIPGCKGYKIRDKYNWWYCSEGGRRHYFALRTAGIVVGKDASFEEQRKKALEVIKGMERIDAEKAKEKQGQ